MEQYTLANGVQIPVIGLGTWQTPDDETGYQAVLSALQHGYRHIDTAQGYRNEENAQTDGYDGRYGCHNDVRLLLQRESDCR